MPRNYHPDNTMPKGNGWVYVFGSNLAGRHGAGAAKAAHVNFGAKYGVGEGPTGKAYAIPTKDRHLKTLSLDEVRDGILAFINFAHSKPETLFFITRIGCGLANFDDDDIAPCFVGAPENCSFPEPWRRYLDTTETRT
ncbi:A1S_2505 family phage non-structural protein [Hydrogenophaga sp. NFH-34]|uniref:A1S_2505 family phage non-structural protein n=1 Tax=Hydrogenophaga sp. NFH-34 TaxID=2744446 RepID=UPI001F1E0BFF|nr:hypothetical protein [Hydrogenophaga sp. NFH-34]